jgi:hypothetical protein
MDEKKDQSIRKKVCEFFERYIYSNRKSYFVLLLVLFVLIVFRNQIMGLFHSSILPVLSVIESNCWSTIVFFLMLCYPIYKLVQCYKNRYYIPLFLWWTLVFVIVFYGRYRFCGWGEYTYNPKPSNWIIGYSDIVMLLLFVFLPIHCIPYCKKSKNEENENNANNDIINDNPIENDDIDILGYSTNAKEFAEKIKRLPVENHSYSVGVIGEWGSGKTSFLNLVKRNLGSQCIIIDFNPRTSKSIDNIQSDFFETLFSKLKQYDFRCSFSFQKYLKSIDLHIDNKLLSLFFSLQGILNKETERKKLEEAIKRLQKKIVVIIEDFDRLFEKEEILEVFKLIDSNASFANVVFITAYDKEQLCLRLLSNNSFSEKFVIWEYYLPIPPYDKILNYFKEELFKRINPSEEEKNIYRTDLQNHKEILGDNLSTIRDIKRFLNMFVPTYNIVKRDVDFRDYVLLTIIKYKNPEEYMKLYNKEFLDRFATGNSSFYCINEDAIKQAKTKKIIQELFPKKEQYRTNNVLSICRIFAFDTYFYNYVFDGIPMEEMDKLLEPDSDFNEIDQWKKNNKLCYVIDYVNSKNILNFKNRITFERYIDVLLHLNNILLHSNDILMPSGEKCNRNVFYNRIRQLTAYNYFDEIKLIMNDYFDEILNHYNYEGNDYKKIISQKLKENYPINIVKTMLIESIKNDREYKSIFSKDELLQMAKNALDDLIRNDSTFKQEHLDLLYSCIDNIDTSGKYLFDIMSYQLDEGSCQKIYELIENNPAGYFENFVGLASYPDTSGIMSIVCKPYWKQIFGSPEKFEQFLETHKNDIPNFEQIDNFWELYKNNGYEIIEDNEQETICSKIDNNLREEREKLEKLLEIQKELTENEKNDNKEECLSKYQELKKRIDSISLYIKLRNDLRKEIEKKIQNNG